MMKYISFLGLIFLMLICFAASVGYAGQLNSEKNIMMLYLEDTPLAVSQVSKILSDEMKINSPIAFAGWSQKNEQELSNPEFNKRAQADVIYICGDSSLVLESSVSLKADDKAGCLISEDTAYDLFGSTNIKDSKIFLGNRELTVRGLLKKKKSTVVIQTTEAIQKNELNKNSETVKFDKETKPDERDANNAEEITIRSLAINTKGIDKDKRDKAINSFMERNGVAGKALDYGIFKNIAYLFSYILPIIIIWIIVSSFIKRAIALKNKPFICTFYLGTAIISLLVAIYICKINLSIPQSMIPNQWSDFDFWQKQFEDYFKELQQLTYILKQKPEQSYLIPMIKAIAFSLLAILAFYISNIRLKTDSLIKLYGLLCISLIMEFIIIILLDDIASLPVNLSLIWLIYPYFLIGKYIIGIQSSDSLRRF